MKRSQIVALLNGFDHFVGDDAGRSKLLTAMYHTMTNCIYLFQGRDCSGLLVGQSVQNHLDGLFVGGHGSFGDLFVTAGFLVNQTAVDADTLAETFCQNILCIRVDELIFQGRASAVNY